MSVPRAEPGGSTPTPSPGPRRTHGRSPGGASPARASAAESLALVSSVASRSCRWGPSSARAPYRARLATDERSRSESAITIPGTGDHNAPESVIRIDRKERSRSAGTSDQDASEPAHGIILERWIAAGYRLGNHTFGHVDLDRTGPDGFLADVERNEPVIVRYSGTEPDRMFRYPYLHEGATLIEREGVRRGLRERRYQIVPVTVDFYYWAGNGVCVRCAGNPGAVKALTRGFREAALRALDWSEETADTLVRRPIKQILLLHVGAFVALTLDDLLSAYEARGVRFVP